MPFHKKLFSLATSLIPGPGGAIIRGITGGNKAAPTRAKWTEQDFTAAKAQCVVQGLAFDTGSRECVALAAPPRNGTSVMVPLPDVDPNLLSPAEQSVSQGQARMGRYGAGMVPIAEMIRRMDCTFGGTVRGLILGDDGLCYNKGQISNKERKWPRGRRPLLTGGEMRAISTAARAAGRLKRTTGRLEKIGMLKKKKSGGYV